MKQIKNYPNYYITLTGKVFKLKTMKWLNPFIANNGYYSVCLYNKDLLSSNTIQSLLKAKSKSYITTVYIWDNSTLRLKQDSIDFLKNDFSKLVYKHTPENQPLSKIYNSVINTLDSEHSDGRHRPIIEPLSKYFPEAVNSEARMVSLRGP
jgi:hypothetical protein